MVQEELTKKEKKFFEIMRIATKVVLVEDRKLLEELIKH